MAEAVIDSSVLLAILLDEHGADLATAVSLGAFISTVNLAEVASRMADKGADPHLVNAALENLAITAVAFERTEALAAAALRATSRHLGLSLGDRACLALAARLGVGVYTADRRWMELDTTLRIELIR